MTIKHKTEYASHYRNDQTLNRVREPQTNKESITKQSGRGTYIRIKVKLKNQTRDNMRESLTQQS